MKCQMAGHVLSLPVSAVLKSHPAKTHEKAFETGEYLTSVMNCQN